MFLGGGKQILEFLQLLIKAFQMDDSSSCNKSTMWKPDLGSF